MVPQPRRPLPDPDANKPRLALAIAIAAIALLLLGGSAIWATMLLQKPNSGTVSTTPGPQATAAAPTATPNVNPTGPVSPFIFGTNMGLFNDNDQVIQSSATRTLMSQMHIKMVRMPSRKQISEPVMIQAAQAIKEIGAAPLIVLHGVQTSSTMLADDIKIVKDMNNIFGDSTVYYEFGNEDDYNGYDVNRYTDAWNTVIPQLKPLAKHAQFIGPVNYQYSADYLTTFLKNAKVQPDGISWHEYTCDLKWKNQDCLNNIDKWTTHISDARQVMASTIGKVLPILITEWNYTAGQSTLSNGLPRPDGKYDNQQFMTDWTTKALKTLVDNRVFASMQYSVTNTALPMINYSNQPTLQGTTFQSLYQQLVPSGS